MSFVQPHNKGDRSPLEGREPASHRGTYRRMSHRLLGLLKQREARCDVNENRIHIGNLMRELGDQSFGWGLVLFALINMIPVPLGTNMVLSLPLLVIGLQMLLGFEVVRLPAFLSNRTLPRAGLNRMVARLRPLFRRIESLAKERHIWILEPGMRGLLGVAVVIMSLALAAPIPTSGWGPAFALFTIGIGMIERDGAIVLGGLVLSLLSLAFTTSLVILTYLGLNNLIGF